MVISNAWICEAVVQLISCKYNYRGLKILDMRCLVSRKRPSCASAELLSAEYLKA
jgi:hypothetical protein